MPPTSWRATRTDSLTSSSATCRYLEPSRSSWRRTALRRTALPASRSSQPTSASSPSLIQPSMGKKLLIRDTGKPGRRAINFLADDRAIVASGVAPTLDGARLYVFSTAGSSDAACFDLPAQRWRARKDAFTYRAPRRSVSPVKAAVLKGVRVLKAVAKGAKIDYTLDEPSQRSVAVVFTTGPATFCANFGGSIIIDRKGQFSARDAPEPAHCPKLPLADCK